MPNIGIAAGEKQAAIEEIIVSARKREERLQDVPIAISAFSLEEIKAAGIRNMADVANLTPGLTLSPLFGEDYWTPVIRGLSTIIGEPNVGFFIDGVYHGARTNMPRLLGNFVESIEVARGPQSALYGRNTFGGAVNYVTRKPSDYTEGELEITAGNRGKKVVQGGLSGPSPVPDWYYRLNGLWEEFDGYFENDLSGDDLDSRDSHGALLSILGLPSADLEIEFTAGFNKLDGGDSPLSFVENNDAFVNNGFLNGFQIFDGDVPAAENFSVTPGKLDSDSASSALRIEWMQDNYRLTSLTGYNELSYDRHKDDDYSAAQYHWTTQKHDADTWSQEFRITSNLDQDLLWMAGIYLYSVDNSNDLNSQYLGDFSELNEPIRGVTSNIVETDLDIDELAFFGSITWSIRENIEATFSGRYTSEEKKVKAFDTNLVSGNTSGFKETNTWSMFLPKLSLDWRINEQHMLYASYARSEKSGGYNVIGQIEPNQRTYDPEKSDNYEIGLKSNFSNNRYLLTFAGFLINWEDQIVRGLNTFGSPLNTNAASSSSQGLEFELIGQPTDRLRLRLGAAYTDSEFDDYTFDELQTYFGIDPVLDGKPLPLVSDWTVNTSVEYSQPLPLQDWHFFSRADWDYRSEQSIVETADTTVGDSDRLNFTLGFRNANWSISLWGRNILDDNTAAAGLYTPNPAGRAQSSEGPDEELQFFQALVTTPEKESWGVTLNYSF